MPMNRVIRMTMAVATAGILAACGGGGDTGGNGGNGGDTAGATLSMVDNAFEPADLTVSAGAEIELTNDGQALHNLTIEEAGIDEDVESGASTTVAVDLEPGQYEMICEYHEAQGMTGTVTVQ